MRQISIETVVARGAVAVLLAAGAARSASGQVVVVGPRQVIKDTVVLRTNDGTRIALDSIRVLLRAFDGQPLSSMQSEKMRRELDAVALAFKTSIAVAGGGGQRIIITGPDVMRQFGVFPAKGWIGLTTGGVHNDWDDGRLVQYLDYPPIVSVERSGPAQVAGIVPGDTLVAYDGMDVVTHPINVAQLLTPDRRIAVTVRRDGENRAFSLVVGRIPNTLFTRRAAPDEFPGFPDTRVAFPGDPPRAVALRGAVGGRGDAQHVRDAWGGGGPFFFFGTDAGVFGASLSPVGPDLAKAFKLEQGVLVNAVPDDTPAARAGLKAGDVIVSVGGQSVSSVGEVRKLAMLRGENRPLMLQIIRDKKARSITVK
jgi:membrane-associated protease RseP (regulator of RpoE activity)